VAAVSRLADHLLGPRHLPDAPWDGEAALVGDLLALGLDDLGVGDVEELVSGQAHRAERRGHLCPPSVNKPWGESPGRALATNTILQERRIRRGRPTSLRLRWGAGGLSSLLPYLVKRLTDETCRMTSIS
jgi:hypothetical protein